MCFNQNLLKPERELLIISDLNLEEKQTSAKDVTIIMDPKLVTFDSPHIQEELKVITTDYLGLLNLTRKPTKQKEVKKPRRSKKRSR